MITNLRLWAVAAVVLIGACDSGSDPAAPPASPAIPGAPGTAVPAIAAGGAPSADDRAILINAYRQSKSRKMRARARMVVTGGEHPGTSSWVGEFAPPAKRMDMTLPGGQRMQMVLSGPQVWVRHSDTGPYMAMPMLGAMAGSAVQDYDQAIIESLENGTATFERIGAETVGGRAMTVYRINSRAPGPTPGTLGEPVTGRTWIAADGLVYKFEGGSATPPTQIFIDYEYDESITIPIPPT